MRKELYCKESTSNIWHNESFLCIRRHISEIFCSKHYFYISYSFRNLHSTMIFSIFNQFYRERVSPILGRTSDIDYFSCGRVWMWELDYKESWALKNWCFWSVVLEKTLESPLDCKEIQPVYSEDQPWDFFGRNDAKAETPVLWPSHANSWLIGKDSDAGRDRRQEEKGITEDEMVGWHHQLNGHEFE